MASLGVSRSLVWKFFLVSEEKDSAKCGTCDKVVKRDTGNTSNLRRHLQTNHPPQYKELLKLEEEKQKEDEEELLVKIKI
jgi:hypothetical protein